MSQAILDELKKINSRLDQQDEKITTIGAKRNAGIVGTFNGGLAPFARRGENIMSSRGFSFQKLLACRGHNANLPDDQAKIEIDICDRFAQKMMSIPGGWKPQSRNSILIPFATEMLSEDEKSAVGYEFVHEIKSILDAGVNGASQQEMTYWQQKALDARGHGQKVGDDPAENQFYEQVYESQFGRKAAVTPTTPMSWVNQGVGGSFVPPAAFGQPIELLRNVSAFADATYVPLPPQGRIQYPRQTSPTLGSWLGENAAVTPTQPGTGLMTLSAKKAMSLVVFPGELLRFAANPSLEMIIRNDMFKTCALTLDLALIYGAGSDNVPLGLVTMAGVAGNPYQMGIVVPGGSNQNLLAGDIYTQFLTFIEQHNGPATHWIMNPAMLYGIAAGRWVSTTTPTNGGFIFSFTRDAANKVVPILAGLPVTKTNQVSVTRGTGAQTSTICLNMEQQLVGMWGAIEWTQSDGGIQLLAADQVAVRALLTCDGGPRYPGLCAVADPVGLTIS